MLLNQIRRVQYSRNFLGLQKYLSESAKPAVNIPDDLQEKICPSSMANGPTSRDSGDSIVGEIYPTSTRVMPLILTDKEPVILSFDDVPGPKSLKVLSSMRQYAQQYVSNIGMQITASALTLGLNIGAHLSSKFPFRNLSTLFDEYGPVVRFVSPIGGDIVLVNHPDFIQKVYTTEDEYPVRSTLDCLDKYRRERRNQLYTGIFTSQGQDWSRQRSLVNAPLHNSTVHHLLGLNDICENFTRKIYSVRNYQDEVPKSLYKDLHKWAFDCMGLILFSKRFNMLDTEVVYSQCDRSWLYHSLDKATDAIMKCESGLRMWKFIKTPAWNSLVKHCDNLDNLIGKYVLEAEQTTFPAKGDNKDNPSLINAMLIGDQKMTPEDITTVVMDLLLIGVNTIASSTAFLLFHLAKYKRVQKTLHSEIEKVFTDTKTLDIKNIRARTPYLQACIKENLRLVPPIPVISRILPKNITLDRYNIPRGTLVIMSTQDASTKERNYDDARVFRPERWLDTEYHAFASVPFGFGARKCLGQNIAETVISMLTIKLLEKFKLEYHYGDIGPSGSFISKPNRPLKIRFLDRI